MSWARQSGVFNLGDMPLSAGGVLRDAKLSWHSHGTLAPARDNVVVYPTSYSAQAAELQWLLGPDGILDPTRWFVVQPDMFGNGLSSSPSNDPDYPALVTSWDNVRAQQRLLAEHFGIARVHCVYGWSMGAQQAYHWAAAFPGMVSRIIALCGSARTAVHNQVFLRSLMAVLEAAPEYIGQGRFSAEPVASMRAFARLYASWALSQDFYRAGLHLAAEPDLESFLRNQWEARWGIRAAANLYAQAKCWDGGDIAAGGDLPQALAAIEAQVLLMPGETDLYFRVADNAAELPHLRHGTLTPIPSIWGHRAGNPMGNAQDTAFVKTHVRAFLEA